MAKYPCKFVSSFILYCVGFSVMLASMLSEGWYIVGGKGSYHFNMRPSYYWGSSYYSSNYGSSYYGSNYFYDTYFNTLLTRSMLGCAITAVSLTGLCLLLSFAMMCADCCCRITKCMNSIPRIVIIFSTIAGILAEITCILLLINIYVVDQALKESTSYTSVIPSYCFYLTIVSGIILFIASCVNCGINQMSEVQDFPVPITVSTTQNSGQILLGQQQSIMYPPALAPAFPVIMPPNQAPVAYPAPIPQGYHPQNSASPWKIFVTNISTQTSKTDLKEAAN